MSGRLGGRVDSIDGLKCMCMCGCVICCFSEASQGMSFIERYFSHEDKERTGLVMKDALETSEGNFRVADLRHVQRLAMLSHGMASLRG